MLNGDRVQGNTKYKKNRGEIPPIKDQRTVYVPVGCGVCIECKKQNARNWQLRLLEAAKDKAQKASENYEQTKETERVKTETITRTVQKIVGRPVYINTCLDDDGVRLINEAGNTSESKSTVP